MISPVRRHTRLVIALAWITFHGLQHDAVAAQDSRPSRVAVDSSAAVDTTVNEGGEAVSGLTVDALVSIDLGRNVQIVTRPFLQRLAASGEWNAQLWLAALRYERTGDVAVRVDAGYIPSPVGMANLQLRPHTNPTIALPASLFSSLPLVDVGGPRTTLLGAMYPLGISATVSSLTWDVRASVMDTSPARTRRVFSDGSPPNPPRFAQFVLGGGVTPFVGIRVGASVTRGGWERAGESPSARAPRTAIFATVEADVSRGHTRVQAEWTRDSFAVNTGHVVARGAFLQGQQTLSPRWFVAGRVERLVSPAILAAPDVLNVVRRTQHLQGFEETLGYRLTPELTLRASHRMRRLFGRDDYDHVGAVSVVWWRRWI
ncbi:MAG: hypothetical protein ABL986_10210 [Vicinamibacterales bacterium]